MNKSEWGILCTLIADTIVESEVCMGEEADALNDRYDICEEYVDSLSHKIEEMEK